VFVNYHANVGESVIATIVICPIIEQCKTVP